MLLAHDRSCRTDGIRHRGGCSGRGVLGGPGKRGWGLWLPRGSAEQDRPSKHPLSFPCSARWPHSPPPWCSGPRACAPSFRVGTLPSRGFPTPRFWLSLICSIRLSLTSSQAPLAPVSVCLCLCAWWPGAPGNAQTQLEACVVGGRSSGVLPPAALPGEDPCHSPEACWCELPLWFGDELPQTWGRRSHLGSGWGPTWTRGRGHSWIRGQGPAWTRA